MKIRQYVYFALHSESLSPDDIAGRVGMRPDEARVRGARQLEPPRPPRNMWAIECDAHGLTIDEQAASVLKRVAPFQAAVKQLVDAGEVNAVLQLVRYFGVYLAEKDGEDEHIDVTPTAWKSCRDSTSSSAGNWMPPRWPSSRLSVRSSAPTSTAEHLCGRLAAYEAADSQRCAR